MIHIIQRAAQGAVLISILVGGALQAQQLSRQSQFVQNPFLVNPALSLIHI